MVYSKSDNVSTVADAEANDLGNLGYATNLTNQYEILSLDNSTYYYVNVIVKNEAGGKTAYTSLQGGTFCFLPDTMITLADGSLRRIDQIMAGDLVRSFDSQGRITVSIVGHVFSHVSPGYLKIKSQHGAEIRATANHPFFAGPNYRGPAKDPGFPEIGHLGLGESVYIDQGGSELLPSPLTQMEFIPESSLVYNLHISSGFSTYIANGYGVHNK